MWSRQPDNFFQVECLFDQLTVCWNRDLIIPAKNIGPLEYKKIEGEDCKIATRYFQGQFLGVSLQRTSSKEVWGECVAWILSLEMCSNTIVSF